jgi:hypothetical protein
MRNTLCCLLLVATAATARAEIADAGKEITLTGTFNWSEKRGRNEDLNAVLTPSGTNEWKAVFTFVWSGTPHTYTGTVKGHLDNGDVSGEALADGGGRTFSFQGRANNHALTFSHFETTGKKNTPTGSGSLKPGPLKTLEKPTARPAPRRR